MAITYRRLGSHGVLVSNICLGTMNLGWHTNEEESFRIMDKALELGINFFDTADVYGWTVRRGVTEEIIGRWLAKSAVRRESIVLATKVYNPVDHPGAPPEPNRDGRNLSAFKIRQHCEGSLRRLQTDHIDLYQVHHVDRECPWDEALDAFDALVTQGKVVYVGSSNFAGWDIATACQEARRLGMQGLASEQSIYNLSNRMVELEVLPACRYYGMGFIPYSPLGGGLLSGALAKAADGRRGEESFATQVEKQKGKIAAYEDLCRGLGAPPAEVALAWLLTRPGVTAPIVGPRTVSQLESMVKATELVLDERTLAKLDEIWPGPGGEAPKAYAW